MPNAMLERVLIPLDGSGRAESILPLLRPILRRSGSEIFLVRALDAPPDPVAFDEADRYLTGIADELLEDGLCVHTLVSAGSAPHVIESLAADEEVTLIAMATHGDSSDDRPVGPVLERMLRDSWRPLLALGPSHARRLALRQHRSILVPLDGSETSRRSLPLAVELAGALDARLVLLRVIEQPSEEPDAIRDLREIVERLHRRGVIAEIWIESGDPAENILRVCRDEDIQLIVQTTQGRSGMSDRIFGEVTLQLMKDSPVPVLAVHLRG
jgi:nucleotide-binding universal stress UspA family protein